MGSPKVMNGLFATKEHVLKIMAISLETDKTVFGG